MCYWPPLSDIRFIIILNSVYLLHSAGSPFLWIFLWYNFYISIHLNPGPLKRGSRAPRCRKQNCNILLVYDIISIRGETWILCIWDLFRRVAFAPLWLCGAISFSNKIILYSVHCVSVIGRTGMHSVKLFSVNRIINYFVFCTLCICDRAIWNRANRNASISFAANCFLVKWNYILNYYSRRAVHLRSVHLRSGHLWSGEPGCIL